MRVEMYPECGGDIRVILHHLEQVIFDATFPVDKHEVCVICGKWAYKHMNLHMGYFLVCDKCKKKLKKSKRGTIQKKKDK